MTAHSASVSSLFSLGALRRFVVYLALWLVLIGFGWTDFAVGVLAAACATWVSVLLLPVSGERVSPTALARLAVRLPWQSLIAGADVARRALDPRLPLRAVAAVESTTDPATVAVARPPPPLRTRRARATAHLVEVAARDLAPAESRAMVAQSPTGQTGIVRLTRPRPRRWLPPPSPSRPRACRRLRRLRRRPCRWHRRRKAKT